MNRAVYQARREFLNRATITASADYVRHHGIDWDRLEAHTGCLALVRGELLPGRHFDFRDDGKALAVIEAIGPDGETPIDLVAWSADGSPDVFNSMFGNVAVLGSAAVENPSTYHCGRPLRVRRTPLAWLQAGCDGVVIVDKVLAVDVLADALGPIAGEDVQHGRELARLLRPYFDPRRIVAPLPRAA